MRGIKVLQHACSSYIRGGPAARPVFPNVFLCNCYRGKDSTVMNRLASSVLIFCLVILSQFPSFAQSPQSQRDSIPVDKAAREARLREIYAKMGSLHMARGRLSAAELLQRKMFAPGEYNVKFKAIAKGGAATLAKSVPSAQIICDIPELGVKTLRIPDSAVSLFLRDPNVEWIEQNAMRYPLQLTPNDPAYNGTDPARNPDFAIPIKWDAHTIQAAEGWELWPGIFFTAAGGKGTA